MLGCTSGHLNGQQTEQLIVHILCQFLSFFELSMLILIVLLNLYTQYWCQCDLKASIICHQMSMADTIQPMADEVYIFKIVSIQM